MYRSGARLIAGMTRIDFHTHIVDKINYACRLVRKALAQSANNKIVLLASNRQQLGMLDNALWTFSNIDFLPHTTVDHPLAKQTPIVLTDDDTLALPHYQMLVNLSTSTPSNFMRFERVFEIVSTDEADAAIGRQRYSYYKQLGYPLTHCIATSTKAS
jgi:DNA polymerase-3 subunit chi